MTLSTRFAVVGGGIAGVCCAEELEALISDNNEHDSFYDEEIILISGCCGFIKIATDHKSVSLIFLSFFFSIFIS